MDDLRTVGERIDALLVASAAHGAVARERAEELVRLVTDLYGAGLERLLEILHGAGRLRRRSLIRCGFGRIVDLGLLTPGFRPRCLRDLGERRQFLRGLLSGRLGSRSLNVLASGCRVGS